MAADAFITVAPRVAKLRDSCNACAAGKVKCPKQKPTCSRCQTRGQKCEYEANRRMGRPYKENLNPQVPGSKQKTTRPRPNSPQERVSPTRDVRLNPTMAYTANSGPTIFDDITMPALTPAGQDILGIAPSYAGVDPLLLSEASSAVFEAEAEEMFSTSISTLPSLESIQCDSLNNRDNSSSSYGESLSNYSNSGFSPFADSIDFMGFGDNRTLKSNDSPFASNDERQSSCGCLSSLLGFLNGFVSNGQGTRDIHSGSSTPPESVHQFVTEHDNILQTAGTVLQCHCSLADGYLFTVLSMVLFKVLDRYVAAGNAVCSNSHGNHKSSPQWIKGQQTASSHGQGSPLSFHQDATNAMKVEGQEEDCKRQDVQRLLGKMHQIQRVVKKMSSRLKGEDLTMFGLDSQALKDNQALGFEATTFTGPFSNTIFHQMEADLRQRMQKVSLATADMLRQL